MLVYGTEPLTLTRKSCNILWTLTIDHLIEIISQFLETILEIFHTSIARRPKQYTHLWIIKCSYIPSGPILTVNLFYIYTNNRCKQQTVLEQNKSSKGRLCLLPKEQESKKIFKYWHIFLKYRNSLPHNFSICFWMGFQYI